jgi:hypothetical protein
VAPQSADSVGFQVVHLTGGASVEASVRAYNARDGEQAGRPWPAALPCAWPPSAKPGRRPWLAELKARQPLRCALSIERPGGRTRQPALHEMGGPCTPDSDFTAHGAAIATAAQRSILQPLHCQRPWPQMWSMQSRTTRFTLTRSPTTRCIGAPRGACARSGPPLPGTSPPAAAT